MPRESAGAAEAGCSTASAWSDITGFSPLWPRARPSYINGRRRTEIRAAVLKDAAPPAKRSAATREELIGATERLICEGGLSAVTTQSVSRECGFSEGTIYRHFDSREELIITTLRERLPGEVQQHVAAFAQRSEHESVEAGLTRFVASIVPIFTNVAPSLGMLAADPALAARNAEAMRADGKGPRQLLKNVGDCLRDEQRLGRISGDIEPRAAAGLLVGLCFYRSLMSHLFGEDPTGLTDDEFPAAVAAIVARGLKHQKAAGTRAPKPARSPVRSKTTVKTKTRK